MDIKYTCNNCKKEFIIKAYHRKRKYCSKDCYLNFRKKNTTTIKCKVCNKNFNIISSRKGKAKYCSQKCAHIETHKKSIGIKRSLNVKNKIKETIRKSNRTPWNKDLIGVIKSTRTGKKSNFWKGGTTTLWQKIVNSSKYRKWRLSVYKRDNYKCQSCGQTGGKLEAHHIKAKSTILRDYIEKNENIDDIEIILKNCPKIIDTKNGITLCVNCHRKTDNYAGKS